MIECHKNLLFSQNVTLPQELQNAIDDIKASTKRIVSFSLPTNGHQAPVLNPEAKKADILRKAAETVKEIEQINASNRRKDVRRRKTLMNRLHEWRQNSSDWVGQKPSFTVTHQDQDLTKTLAEMIRECWKSNAKKTVVGQMLQ